jgi:DNA-directed RNA polymerase specialized sigma24 family protein
VARSLEEPPAFADIFDRHFGAVHRYLHRRAGRDFADDLAAETFALAFERRETCRSTGSVLPWLYGIATNLLRHRRRAESRQLRAYGRTGLDHWVADFARMLERFPRGLVCLDLGIDPSTPAGEMTATVVAAMAQMERRLIGQRTKDALAVKRAEGESSSDARVR